MSIFEALVLSTSVNSFFDYGTTTNPVELLVYSVLHHWNNPYRNAIDLHPGKMLTGGNENLGLFKKMIGMNLYKPYFIFRYPLPLASVIELGTWLVLNDFSVGEIKSCAFDLHPISEWPLYYFHII